VLGIRFEGHAQFAEERKDKKGYHYKAVVVDLLKAKKKVRVSTSFVCKCM